MQKDSGETRNCDLSARRRYKDFLGKNGRKLETQVVAVSTLTQRQSDHGREGLRLGGRSGTICKTGGAGMTKFVQDILSASEGGRTLPTGRSRVERGVLIRRKGQARNARSGGPRHGRNQRRLRRNHLASALRQVESRNKGSYFCVSFLRIVSAY